jgi:hypothetical protein
MFHRRTYLLRQRNTIRAGENVVGMITMEQISEVIEQSPVSYEE